MPWLCEHAPPDVFALEAPEDLPEGDGVVVSRGAARLDEPAIVQRMFMLTDTMGDYHTSMAIDYVLARPLEVEMILGNPLRRAGELGIAAPTVAALYALVRAADRRNQGVLPVITPDRV